MLTPINNVVLKGSKGNYIDFTFDIKSRSGSSTGEAVIATYTFNNSGNIKKVTQIYDAGTSVHFLADEYLEDGANSISVSIIGRSTLAGTLAAVNYTVVALTFTSDFNFGVPVEQSDYLAIPYHLEGAGVKYIEWYVDGALLQDIDTIPDFNVNRTKNIDISELTVGKHNVQARAFTTSGGVNFYSSTLYFDFVVAPENLLWNQPTTFMLLGLTLPQLITGDINVNATQYEDFICQAAVYDSKGRSLDVSITDNATLLKTIVMYTETPQEVTYAPTEIGEHVLIFTADSASSTLTITVVAGEIDITETVEGLTLKLSAKGRSNNEANPATWTYNDITTSFSGFSWNDQDGWIDGSLTIPIGGNINIDLAPLSGNVVNTGRTIEIDFETFQVSDEDATIMSIVNPSTNAGIDVTATSAKIVASGGARVETKYRDGDRLHVTFIINKTSGDNARMIYIVNNGILERASRFATTDNFTVNENIIIGSTGCMIRVHSIRVYDRAISVDESFCNYAVDSPNLINIATNNDIFDATTGEISVDKVNARIPVMIITGDISYILGITDKSQKNAWNPYPVNIEFRNMQNPEMNFYIDDADIRLQGTSSISYPRKNFRIYSASKSGKYNTKLYSPTHDSHDLIESGKYAFKTGSAPVNCWCLKADYAESSGSHNVGVAKIWNKLMYDTINQDGTHPLRTDAQNWAEEHDYPYDVRTTIDGFPIVLFQRDNENAPLTCFGQYNFNNDKSTEDVYGFTALKVVNEQGEEEVFDNSKVQCWEVLDSDNSIALFTDISDFDTSWGDAFEARYPDKNKKTTALKRVSQWINSCYLGMSGDTMQIDLQKWQEEKENYFDLPKLAAYYIYLLRFGAVDQTVKNAMFTTYDGNHWFYINYDNDTILGIDNASRLFSVWDYGLKTKTPQGGYYYAGKGMSVLWNCFEADPECMQLAKDIDEKLFAAGLTYENILQIFDTEQSSRWCERIYNENGRYKYIEQALLGQNVLYMLQGSRKSHRHWWLQHRLEKYDNEFGNGTYTRRSIQARSTSEVNIPQGATYKFIPAKSANYGYSVASTVVDPPTAREAGVEYTSTGLPQATGVGNLIYIYNANNLYKLDLSGYITALGTVNLSSAINVNGESELKQLILGDGVNENNYLTNISGLTTIKNLEVLNIQGYKAITSLDLEGLSNLHTIYAGNSGLTSFVPAPGTVLTTVELPSGLQSLILNENSVTNLIYTPTKSLINVTISNIKGSWDDKTFVNNWLSLFTDEELINLTINLTGINWTNVTPEQIIKVGKIGTKTLRGKVTLTSIDQNSYDAIVEVFGDNVFSPDSQFIIDAPDSVFISGPTQLLSSEEGQFICAAFPVTENAPLYFLYNSSGTQVTANATDERGKYYYTGNEGSRIKLYESSGIVVIESGLSSDTTVKVRARISGTSTWSDYITLQTQKLVMPVVTITSGVGRIREVGSYDYPFTLGTYNAELQRVEATFNAPDSVATVGLSGSRTVIVNVLNVLENNSYTLRISAICKQGTVYAEKSIKITDSEVIMDSESNPEVLAVCYAQGWCASADVMTVTEALNVTNIGTAFNNKYNITHFEEFQYFKNVTRLQGAFKNCYKLTSIVVPENLQYMSYDAFQSCSKLSFIRYLGIAENFSGYISGDFPQLKTAGPIGGGYNIEVGGTFFTSNILPNNIEEIVIPEEISKVNPSFSSFTKLTSINVDVNNLYFSSEDGVLFDKEKTKLLSFPRGKNVTTYTIPNSVTVIGQSAFRNCTQLTHIILGDNVTTFESYCFEECNKNMTMDIGPSLTTVPSNSTGSDNTLAPVRRINYKGTLEDWLNKTWRPYYLGGKYQGSTKGTYSLYISGVEVTDLTFSDSVISIGSYAFENCNSLASVTIPNTVASIGTSAFSTCTGLTSVHISDLAAWCAINFRDYSANPLYSAHNLYLNDELVTDLVIPNGTTNIGNSTFAYCNMTSVTIPNSVRSIGNAAFRGCAGLTSITIPDSVTSIGSTAFYESGLTLVTIPNSVTSIGDSAFAGCTGLTSVTIGNRVTSIGQYVFRRCVKVETITCLRSTAPSVSGNTFGLSSSDFTGKDVTGTKTLYVPSGATGYNASSWNSVLLNPSYCNFVLSATL